MSCSSSEFSVIRGDLDINRNFPPKIVDASVPISNMQIKIVRKGFNYITGLINIAVENIVRSLILKDSVLLGSLTIRDTKVSSYRMAANRSWFRLMESNNLLWQSRDFSIDLSGKLSGRIQSLKIEELPFQVSFDSLDFAAGAEIFEKNARLYLVFASCNLKYNHMELTFSPEKLRPHQTSTINRQKDVFDDHFRRHLSNELCDSIKKFVDGFNQQAARTPVNDPLFNVTSRDFDALKLALSDIFPPKAVKGYASVLENLYLDFGLVRNPVVSYDTINLFSTGRLSWMGSGGGPPISSSNPPDTTLARSYEKMAYVTVSDHVFNSFLYHIHRRGNFDVKVNRKEMPSLANLLRFDCHENEICMNYLFPEFAAEYFDHSMEIKFSSTPKIPRVVVNQREFLLLYTAKIVLSAVKRSKTKVLLEIDVSTKTEFNLWFNNSLSDENRSFLNGTCRVTKFENRLINSISPVVDQTNMESLNIIAPVILEQMINKALKRGIPLPNVGGMSFLNSNLRLLDGKVRLETDFYFTQSFPYTFVLNWFKGNRKKFFFDVLDHRLTPSVAGHGQESDHGQRNGDYAAPF
uniref:Lipid-binding serum glycoprotein C-terminal domain-containing protein n=1 Tax=Romanomermis culicivorax TaxID=13658 RepID=A0A915KDK8_ROMCU